MAYFVLKNRCPDKGRSVLLVKPPKYSNRTHTVNSLTIADVNNYLNDLSMANTKRDRPAMKKALQMLLRNTSALEQVPSQPYQLCW